VRIETPQGEIRLVEPGAYRIDAGAPEGNDRDTVLVTTLMGRAEIAGPNVRVPVERGQTAEIDNGYRIAMTQGESEAIDDFARRRLAQERYASAPRYVSDEYSGYEDLGAYGDWEDTADYGAVWYPRGVAVDWAPYRDGRWEFVGPWGWTWIDDAPWGFTPFHYGRWTQVRGRWCWTPGEFARRPVYAPALVSFIGGGSGYGVDNSVGWIPLAPREIYRPWYGGYGTTYARNINITNVDRTVVNRITVENIRNVTTNNYHNDDARTFVRQDDFRRAAPVRRAVLKGPGPGVGRTVEPIAIDKIRPAGRDFGPNGQAGVAHGHAPRIDHRRVVMTPPTSNVVPRQATTPIGQPGPLSDWRGDRGAPPRDRQAGDTRAAVVTGDHRQPPPPPGRAFGSGSQHGGDQRRSDARSGNFSGAPQTDGQNNSQVADTHQPVVADDLRQHVRASGYDGQRAGNRRDDGARRGLAAAPNTSAPAMSAPVATPPPPIATVGSVRDTRHRGPAGWQGNPATAANGQTPAGVPSPGVDRSFGGRGGHGDRQGSVQIDNQQRGRREEPRQPIAATPSPAPSPLPDQPRGPQGGGQDMHRQVSPQRGATQAPPANAAALNNTAPVKDDDRHGKHHRQDGRD
jgi:hypothetical protein